jgi:type I restriction enzyme S subunit
MKYEKLGVYVKQVNKRNIGLNFSILKGINMNKEFFPSVANTIGTDMEKYRVVNKGQFAFNPMHVGRDHLVPISLHLEDEPIIVSPAYVVFEVIKPKELLPQYLMFWFRESDFDRRAWFTTDNSVRGGFSWESFCDLIIPIPDAEIQAMVCLKDLMEKQQSFIRQKALLNLSLKG